MNVAISYIRIDLEIKFNVHTSENEIHPRAGNIAVVNLECINIPV